jgi:hypothetical protein
MIENKEIRIQGLKYPNESGRNIFFPYALTYLSIRGVLCGQYF